MKLKEMLEELRENMLRDESDQISPGDHVSMWSQATLVRYINDAQNRFCIGTKFLRDESTPEICNIVLVAGQESYALDPRVIDVFGVSHGVRRLRRGTYGALFNRSGDQAVSSMFCDNDLVRWQEQPDNYPTLFYTDRETQKIGVYPRPGFKSDGQVLRLRVARRPLKPLELSNLDASPELPEDHHMDLLDWAAWRCLRNHDVDTENLPKASTHKKRFEDAMVEVSREMKKMQTDDVQFDLHNNWSNC